LVYLNDPSEVNKVRRNAIVVNIGGYAVARDPAKIATWALGSCIAIVFYDPFNRVGALAHPMLPQPIRETDMESKYVSTAIPLLLRKLREEGSNPRYLQAAVIGGARILDVNGLNIGQRNYEMAFSIFRSLNIPIVAKDVGGRKGRNVVLDTATGTVYVWYPGLGVRLLEP